MRLTIIRADKAVYIDSVVYTPLSMEVVPLNVHALQWFDVKGWVEFNDGSANEEITTLPEWATACIQEWEVANYEYEHPPSPTPAELIYDCKMKALGKLYETDYSELADVRAVLLNANEFTVYRAQVRALFLNPVVDPVWPIMPQAQWAAD